MKRILLVLDDKVFEELENAKSKTKFTWEEFVLSLVRQAKHIESVLEQEI